MKLNNNLKKPYYKKNKDNLSDSVRDKNAEKTEEDNNIFGAKEVLQNVGGNIRRIRKMHKMSINDLANKANMSSKYLQGVEVGKRNISVTNLSKIASVLEVSTGYLFITSDNEKSSRLFEISNRLKNYNNEELNSVEKLIVDIENIHDKK